MKDFLTLLATPSGAAYGLFVLGLLAVLFRRTRKGSWWLLAGSGLVNLLFSSGTIAALLMSPLEYTEPRLLDPQRHEDIRSIVVLTGWASDDADLPLTARMNASSAYRVLLTMELHRARPDCTIIVSGESVTARIMAESLVNLGVPRNLVKIDDQAPSTEHSINNIRQMLGTERFFLVTSAGHLPRTMESARRARLQPVAAPTDFQLPRDWRNAEISPRPESLAVANLAVHEYLGRAWYAVKAGS